MPRKRSDDRIRGKDVDDRPGGGVGARRSGGRGQQASPLAHQLGDRLEIIRAETAGPRCRRGEPFDPLLDLAVTEVDEAPDVSIARARQHDADWRDIGRRHSTAAQHDVDQGPTGAAVPVIERVDGLELGVDHRRLDERRQQVVVDGVAQIVKQIENVLGTSPERQSEQRAVVVCTTTQRADTRLALFTPG